MQARLRRRQKISCVVRRAIRRGAGEDLLAARQAAAFRPRQASSTRPAAMPRFRMRAATSSASLAPSSPCHHSCHGRS